MNTTTFLVLCCLCIAFARNIHYDLEDSPQHFEEFMRTYNKHYKDNDEKMKRYKIFVENLEKVNEINKESKHAVHGINKFSDLTSEEFLQTKTCYHKNIDSPCDSQVSLKSDYSTPVPTQFDWREKGVVSKVKDQGMCGSCWAFSVIGNIESVNTIKTNKSVLLSEQQLVDCDKSSDGCNGGTPDTAFSYLIKNGVMSEKSYPYLAKDGKCKYDAKSVAVKISNLSCVNVTEDKLQEKLYQLAPLSIGIDGTTIQTYTDGILFGMLCDGKEINHAVLLVGYGVENRLPYWLFKNSWGTDWGEEGYFRAQRGVNCLKMMDDHAITAIMS